MTEGGSQGEVDYAVPWSVAPSRAPLEARPAEPSPLWGGRGRTALLAGCWAAAGALLLTVLVPLLVPDEQGGESPEAAVEQLLQGIADLDPVAVVAAVDPAETDDPERADAAYTDLSSRLSRFGEQVPLEVTRVLLAVERQLGGTDLSTVATLAALSLELDGLELSPEVDPGDPAGHQRVYLTDGTIDVALDPSRLPDGADGLDPTSYEMPLAEGWRRDRAVAIEPFLTTVERDGRWYVSLEATAAALLTERG